MTSAPWRELDDPSAVAERLVAVYEVLGEGRYDEAVTQATHAAQCAALARAAGADDSLVVAALLHDLGHLLGGDGRAAERTRDLRHEEVAARFLSRWFGTSVTEPIRHHVAAKRYLCAVEPDYHDTLSPASVRSLELQGGVMTADEADAFARLPGAEAAAALRRWDDLAKDPTLVVPPVRSYLDALVTVGEQPRGA
jgi:phosphonate degradation associated HDIG domain protein